MTDTHTAIVGSTGAGKTVTAKGHVEALLDANRHVCIIDPTGAWYGLRSDVSGEGPGFDIPIFGGSRGDVAITAEQGEAVGNIIAGGVSAIVDVSGLRTGAEQRRFVRDLLRALRAKPDDNFHVVVDEADEFAAQKPRDNYGFEADEELVWMAKRGRLAGFVLTIITQRPASIDKEVLSQAQTLIVHQLISPVDQRPIVAYLKDHADKATLNEIRGSLATLARGERWIYAPQAGVLERGFSPMPRTFDSSRTPKAGERAVEPKMLASIDIAAIKAALAPVQPIPADPIEAYRAGGEVGALLIEKDAEIARLRRRIADLVTERDALRAACERKDRRIRSAESALAAIRGAFEDFAATVAAIEMPAPAGQAEGRAVEENPTPHSRSKRSPRPVTPQGGPPATLQSDSIARPGPTRDAPSAATLNAAARKMLEMLERIAPARVTWGSLASMIGNKARGGNFNAARKAMRESGQIVEDGETVRSASPPAGGMDYEEAFALWNSVLSNPAPRMMQALDAAPAGLTRVALGEALGIAPRGGNFNSGVAQLIQNGVAVDRAGVLHLASPLPGERA